MCLISSLYFLYLDCLNYVKTPIEVIFIGYLVITLTIFFLNVSINIKNQ